MFAEPNADTAENIVKLTETNKKKTQQTGIFVKLVDFSFQICINFVQHQSGVYEICVFEGVMSGLATRSEQSIATSLGFYSKPNDFRAFLTEVTSFIREVTAHHIHGLHWELSSHLCIQTVKTD